MMNELNTLTLQGGDITLSSTWSYGTTEYGKLYTAPTTAYDALTFDLSALPAGAIVRSAHLTCQRYGVGEIRTMDGTDADSKEIEVSRLVPGETLRLVFAYKAHGSVGVHESGTLSMTAGWLNIRLVLTYALPYTAPTAPAVLSVSETEAHPGQALTLSWSGAQAGNQVEIAGYAVYCAVGGGTPALVSQTQQPCISLFAPLSACSVRYRVQTLGSVPGYDSALSSAAAQVTVLVSPTLPPVQLQVVPDTAAPGGEAVLQWSGAQNGQNNALRGFAIEAADEDRKSVV